MKQLVVFCATVSLLSQVLAASPKSDSIAAFTGARAKVVWMRMIIRNADWTARTKAQVTAEGCHVMLLDTDEGQERDLGAGITTWFEDKTVLDNVRISRSGKWVTVHTMKGKTYIFGLTGTNANKRVFLDGNTFNYWCVKAWGRDEASPNTEYAYALQDFGDNGVALQGYAIWKIPVNADGSANTAGAKKIYTNNAGIDNAISVSADQKKIGGEYPWDTDPGILDVASGPFVKRLSGEGACHTNLAADNSYRFFHSNDGHNVMQMWDANLSATHWSFTLSRKMVNGYTGSFWCPRWSNHTLFIASTYPEYPPDYDAEVGTDAFWNWSAATIQSKPLRKFMFCVVHKLTSDYKTIQSSMALTSEPRCWDYIPDMWVASGSGATSVAASKPSRVRTDGIHIVQTEKSVRLDNAAANGVLRLTDSRGRVVAQTMDSGALLTIDGLKPGAYVVSSQTANGTESKRFTVVN